MKVWEIETRQGRKTNLMILKIRLYLINEWSLLNCNYLTVQDSRVQMIDLKKLQMMNPMQLLELKWFTAICNEDSEYRLVLVA